MSKKHKKKKLTPAERAELAREEEERLRKIEIELADAEATPKTADQFERLVLANPSSSMLWIKYMAFHLEVLFLKLSIIWFSKFYLNEHLE